MQSALRRSVARVCRQTRCFSGATTSKEAAKEPLSVLNVLELDLAAVQAKEKDIHQKVLYALAGNENLRQKQQVELKNAKGYAMNKFAKDVLEIADALDKAEATVPKDGEVDEATQALLDGVLAVDSILHKAFENSGITKVDPLGKTFDKATMENVFELTSEKPKGEVLKVMSPVYYLNDKLLRSGKVSVSKGP